MANVKVPNYNTLVADTGRSDYARALMDAAASVQNKPVAAGTLGPNQLATGNQIVKDPAPAKAPSGSGSTNYGSPIGPQLPIWNGLPGFNLAAQTQTTPAAQTPAAKKSGGSGGGSGTKKSDEQIRLESIEANMPVYNSRYQDQIDGLLSQIMGRGEFKYDFANDPIYQQYAQNYMNLGKLAMQDTMGQAAALTGGYGSSYATQAGQQAYNQYLTQLNNVIPELRQTAYDIWNDTNTSLATKLSMLQSLENGDYAKFQDQLSQWNADRSYYYTKAQNAPSGRSGGGGGGNKTENDALKSAAYSLPNSVLTGTAVAASATKDDKIKQALKNLG